MAKCHLNKQAHNGYCIKLRGAFYLSFYTIALLWLELLALQYIMPCVMPRIMLISSSNQQ